MKAADCLGEGKKASFNNTIESIPQQSHGRRTFSEPELQSPKSMLLLECLAFDGSLSPNLVCPTSLVQTWVYSYMLSRWPSLRPQLAYLYRRGLDDDKYLMQLQDPPRSCVEFRVGYGDEVDLHCSQTPTSRKGKVTNSNSDVSPLHACNPRVFPEASGWCPLLHPVNT